MLESILDTLTSIGDFFASVVEWVADFIEDLVTMAKYLGQAVIEFPTYFDWMPASVVALLVTAVGIVVIYKFLGRD